MTRKRVAIRCHGLLAAGPEYEVGWDDIYLRTHDGRRPLYLAPMVESRLSVAGELEVQRSLLRDIRSMLPTNHAGVAELRRLDDAGVSEEIWRLTAILERLEEEPFVVEPLPRTGPDWRMPNLYTAAPMLHRAEVERALRWWLGLMGFPNVGLRWKTVGTRSHLVRNVSFEHLVREPALDEALVGEAPP